MRTDNLRIEAFEPVDAPVAIQRELPADEPTRAFVAAAREEIRDALWGRDPRPLCIVGPCSIHDPEAAVEYATRLCELREALKDKLQIAMRVYFEKPRTTVGWKGLINDPHLDDSCDVNEGLRAARRLLLRLSAMGMPCATEFLDPIVPQYTSDLVAWAAIGARTTESQTHREMVSGLSMPVGFKNATDGDLKIALDGMVAARGQHAFLGITQEGTTCVVRTRGNPDVHIVLRGGRTPNYQGPHIAFTKASLEPTVAPPRPILVDCSHGNSNKDHTRQPAVLRDVLSQIEAGEAAILGVMLESNLEPGKQKLTPGGEGLVRGQSITDACIGWETTDELLREAADRL
ncbi:MAG: 3-deoxy-7-phosphoheptulonate synthase [Planctomycetota bacterium]|jgi:3-deoxy-7-phosphoheptulonate synthase